MPLLVLAALVAGLPVTAGALSVQAAGHRIRSAGLLYLLGATAAFLALLIGVIVALNLLPVLA